MLSVGSVSEGVGIVVVVCDCSSRVRERWVEDVK